MIKKNFLTLLLIQSMLFIYGCGAMDSASDLADDKTPLTVLNYNTFLLNGTGSNGHVEDRVKLIPENIASKGADIVILQEVWKIEHREFIIKELKEHGYLYSASYEAPEGRTGWDVYGNGLLVLSKFKPVGEPKFEAWKNWTRLLERKSTKGVLRIDIEIAEGKIVSVFNAHTSTKLFKDGAYKASHIEKRLLQIQQITDFMAKAKEETGGAPQILALDLNSHFRLWLPESKSFSQELSAEYKQLIKDGNLEDTFLAAGGAEDSATFDPENGWVKRGFFGEEPPVILDYIFTTKGAADVVSSEIVFTEDFSFSDGETEFSAPLSDHYGILSQINL